ncbi:MAG: hypothetical protein U1F36_23115 [Planctomycetota bacterium]
MPALQRRALLVNSGRIHVTRGGVGTSAESVRREAAKFDTFAIPDLLGHLQNTTDLTRSTLIEILRRSGRLADVFVDAQAFLDRATSAIRGELHRLLVGGIRYEKLTADSPDSEWEMTRFVDGELFDYLSSLQVDPRKSP